MPDVVELIRAKRDGRRLADGDISWLIGTYTSGGVIADEQMSALLMAIYFRGLDPTELRAWTAAMIDSGERLDLSAVAAPTVDKHSTGGVGDKVSLVLAPLVASCGAAVPQLSGRGLGHTGGTLDKLESIPGWRAELGTAEMISVLRAAGCVICAAGRGLAPADRMLYALRDVTGTVESIPLIASSIMSKKIAEGTAALVLDVKVGTGAFMRDISEARLLAQTMVTLGEEHGVRTTALLTRMDTPLGRAVGNAVEVEEAVAMLAGSGGPPDLAEVTLALAAEMLTLAGLPAGSAEPAPGSAGPAPGPTSSAGPGSAGPGSAGPGSAGPAAALADGRALEHYRAMIRAQGGDPDAPLPRAAHTAVLTAAETGWLRRLDARAVGMAAWRLGAGRARKEDPVSAAAGVICLAKPGDRVERGQPLLELRGDVEARFAGATEALTDAIEIGSRPPEPASLILERIGS
ncbi:MAG: thymidine phosphorylase [Streptosporangiaceae bacterium]